MSQENNEQAKKPQLVYVMDPMCSWCYGFAPVMQRVAEEYKGQLELKLVMGGLRPGSSTELDEQYKRTLRHHWQEVEQITDQPFSYKLLDEGFIYDSEPACRAVVTMRYMKPEAEFAFAEALQKAFYAYGKDINKTEVLANVALGFDVELEVFIASFVSEEAKEKTAQDFMIAHQLQANAFPSLYLLSPKKLFLLNRGYRMYEAVQMRLQEALDGLEQL
ncbi:DsbA family protein [Pontibacter harenae]|uniref:DsbA family protein n=1 Tax=Pontibacter harenae TaxID=2894083 RepID=UPI001E619658|nr:DsbA family protein [Pontibacter harenae]MCC9167025.1 DsbA family protein [Pontibacter harenae]